MDDAAKLQMYLQTLGDANRLKMINYIGERECSVSEIVESTGLSQPLVSHHLRTLRESQILETERKGPFVYYKLKDKRLLSALGILLEISGELKDRKPHEAMFCSPPWWTSFWGSK
ncbi:MAG: metalloregulator ArsR/SmtB family transcription factor [Clostridia bacterium]|nr:metalloregulator ArsR/SmtB family transcription factor [Clostridia bacterium]